MSEVLKTWNIGQFFFLARSNCVSKDITVNFFVHKSINLFEDNLENQTNKQKKKQNKTKQKNRENYGMEREK